MTVARTPGVRHFATQLATLLRPTTTTDADRRSRPVALSARWLVGRLSTRQWEIGGVRPSAARRRQKLAELAAGVPSSSLTTDRPNDVGACRSRSLGRRQFVDGRNVCCSAVANCFVPAAQTVARCASPPTDRPPGRSSLNRRAVCQLLSQ